ncbi:MAG TPA: PRC-barrel domain-containing protein [Candidatus Sulfotelmatobacter sp.]|nr:PRC-barrel domain-containing protein [Candidatus Sulfotelmatobacter sp.]
MAHYGTLKDTPVAKWGEDVRGSHLYGVNDEKLGKIEDVIFDHSSGDIRYVVVDTGGWLSSKKFIVPADALRSSAKHEKDFEASLTKQQIENFPPYNESHLESESKWSNYERSYRSKWVTDPVMHRAETDRNITPTTLQESGNLDSERTAAQAHGRPSPKMASASTRISTNAEREADIEAADSPTDRIIPAGSDAVVISMSASGIGDRWDTFQSRLRERRKEAVATCHTCTGESAEQRGTESTDTLRKAV